LEHCSKRPSNGVVKGREVRKVLENWKEGLKSGKKNRNLTKLLPAEGTFLMEKGFQGGPGRGGGRGKASSESRGKKVESHGSRVLPDKGIVPWEVPQTQRFRVFQISGRLERGGRVDGSQCMVCVKGKISTSYAGKGRNRRKDRWKKRKKGSVQHK